MGLVGVVIQAGIIPPDVPVPGWHTGTVWADTGSLVAREARAWEDRGPLSGFAGGPGGRFFGFGEVRLAILSLLQEGPKHGYQLIKELTDRSGGLYRASAGTVYPTLQQLEDEGLVQSDHQDGRKVYRLTPEGVQELEREKETVERIWKRAERWGDWGQWAGRNRLPFSSTRLSRESNISRSQVGGRGSGTRKASSRNPRTGQTRARRDPSFLA